MNKTTKMTIATVAVAGTAVALATTPEVLAADTTTTPDAEVTTTAKTYTVSDDQIQDITKRLDDTKNKFNNKKNDSNGLNNQIQDRNNKKKQLDDNKKQLENDINDAKNIKPGDIDQINGNIETKTKLRDNKQTDLDNKRTNEDNKLANKNKKKQRLTEIQNELDGINSDVDNKRKMLDPQAGNNAQKRLQDANSNLDQKNKDRNNAQKELDDAKKHDEELAKRKIGANSDLNNKKQNRDDKQRLLDEAKRKQKEADDALKKAFPYPTKFLATQEWLDTFNKFRNTHNEVFDMHAWETKNPITDDTDPEEYAARMDKAMDEFYADKYNRELEMLKKLQVIENSQPKANDLKYGNKADDKITYEINNLPQDVLLELSQYFAHLVNDARSQLGISDKIKVHLDAIEFAKEVARSVVNNNATIDGHFGRGINDAARKRGLATSADPGVDTEKQYYENLMTSKRSDNTVTRSELFAYLYKYFNVFMHEGQLTGHYNHALSLIDSKNVGISFSHLQDGTFKLHAISINPGFVKNDTNNVEYEKRYGAATLLDNVTYQDMTELQKAYDNATKAVEKATQDLDKATKDVTDAQNKVDELSKIKEKTKDAEDTLAKAVRAVKDAEADKAKAEENLRNVTADQASKQKALDEAIKAQTLKRVELTRAQIEDAQATKEYNDAVKARKDVEAEIASLTNEIAELTKHKQDLQNKLANRKANEAELVKIQNEIQKVMERIAELTDAQSTLTSELTDLEKQIKDLEKEYARLLAIYTTERNPGGTQFDPNELPHIDIEETTRNEDIDFKVIEQNDDTLEVGKRVVKRVGRKGHKVVKVMKFTENGILKAIKEEVVETEDAIDEIVLVGTKKPVNTIPGTKPGTNPGDNQGTKPSVNPETKPGTNPGNQPSSTIQAKQLPATGDTTTSTTIFGIAGLLTAFGLRRKNSSQK